MSNLFNDDEFTRQIEQGFREVRRFGIRVFVAVLAFWAFVIGGIIFAVVKIFG